MNEIEKNLKENLQKVIKEHFSVDLSIDDINIEIPKNNTFGDYSTNAAMRLTKILKKNPQLIAKEIIESLNQQLDNTDKIEIAGPGFINFWMKKAAMANIINTVIENGDSYGTNSAGKGEKILVEFVSANPTGTLHCGHARGAAWGDATCRLLKKSGFDVLREYYVNDAGHQIDVLGESLYARYLESYGKEFTLPEDGYHGKDVIEIMEKIKAEVGDKYLTTDKNEAVEYFKKAGRDLFLDKIDKDLQYFRVKMDSWISEKWIVSQGRVDAALKTMIDKGLTYEKDGAFWFKSTEYGDDKDRVLKKSDGYYTYLTPDVANHIYKLERGYEKLVDLWGADHHGYIPRMSAAIEALGHAKDAFEVDIIQMVRMVENGVEVKMSKRTGNAITLRELCDDIGVDAARYFFVSKAVETHMDLDLGVARSKTNDNPVYYAQYAYARICSILRQANRPIVKKDSYDLLVHQKEVELLKRIGSFVNVVSDAAVTRSPNKICNFIQSLAGDFHSFYAACKVNDPANPELTDERLALLEATRITLKSALDLVGVDAPEKM